MLANCNATGIEYAASLQSFIDTLQAMQAENLKMQKAYVRQKAHLVNKTNPQPLRIVAPCPPSWGCQLS
jgi:hypothetical protein